MRPTWPSLAGGRQLFLATRRLCLCRHTCGAPRRRGKGAVLRLQTAWLPQGPAPVRRVVQAPRCPRAVARGPASFRIRAMKRLPRPLQKSKVDRSAKHGCAGSQPKSRGAMLRAPRTGDFCSGLLPSLERLSRADPEASRPRSRPAAAARRLEMQQSVPVGKIVSDKPAPDGAMLCAASTTSAV
jgi:hypothetical protein